MQRPSSAHTITPFNKQQQQQRPSTAFIRTLSSAVTGSESAAPPRRPGSALLTPNRSTPLLRAPTAFTRHYQQLHHGRSLAVVSDGLWRRDTSDGLRPPRTADAPGLRAAQRGFSHSQMKTRGVANSVASAALAGSQSTPQILQLAVVSDYGDEEEADDDYNGIAAAAAAAEEVEMRGGTAASSRHRFRLVSSSSSNAAWDPIDAALADLVPPVSRRPPQRVALHATAHGATLKPPLKTAPSHGASIAANRVEAHNSHLRYLRDDIMPTTPFGSRSLALSRKEEAEATAFDAAAKAEALRVAKAKAEADKQKELTGKAQPPGVDLHFTDLDPTAERLFTEPKFRAPPRQLSQAEIQADLTRKLGPQGSLARTLADGGSEQVAIMRVANLAMQALRKLQAFKHLPDEALLRLVRLGRLQKKSRYQQFYHEGSQAKDLFILVSGTVRLSAGRDQKGGREIKPPAVCGLEALAALASDYAYKQQGPSYSHRLEGAMAVRPSICLLIRSEAIRACILEIAAKSPFSYFKPPKDWEGSEWDTREAASQVAAAAAEQLVGGAPAAM